MHEEGVAAYVVCLARPAVLAMERELTLQVMHQDVFSRYCGGVSWRALDIVRKHRS